MFQSVYLECTKASHKFYELIQDNRSLTKHWGRIHTKGRKEKITYPTAQKANAAFHRILKQKLNKGYVHTTQSVYKHGTHKKQSEHKHSVKHMKCNNKVVSKKVNRAHTIQRICSILEDDFKLGIAFQEEEGWTTKMRKRAKDSIPYYVDRYTDIAKESPGNIVEMISEDIDTYM